MQWCRSDSPYKQAITKLSALARERQFGFDRIQCAEVAKKTHRLVFRNLPFHIVLKIELLITIP